MEEIKVEYNLAKTGQILFSFYDDNEGILIPSLKGTITANIVIKSEGSQSLQDSYDTPYKETFTSDSKGGYILDLNGFLSQAKIQRFITNYYKKYTISIRFIIDIPKTNNYDYLIYNYDINANWVTVNNLWTFNSINFNSWEDYIYLTSGSEIDIIFLRTTFKEAEERYLLSKKRYDAAVIAEDINIEDIIAPPAPYEPSEIKQVITRLLEFQVGTLTSGMELAKKENMDLFRRLDNLNKSIISITKFYPNLTIDNGEGIPYNKEVKEIVVTPEEKA